MTSTLAFKVKVQSEMDIHLAIHKASLEMKAMQMDVVKSAKIKTSISELGYNIIKYAKIGFISFYHIETDFKNGVKIIASDRGPGIKDINQALEDNYSSSGTLGLGLPGIKRLMDDFSIKSEVDKGTEVTIIMYS